MLNAHRAVVVREATRRVCRCPSLPLEGGARAPGRPAARRCTGRVLDSAPQPGLAGLTRRLDDSPKTLLPICRPDASAAHRFSSPTFSAKWAGVSPALDSAAMHAVSGKANVFAKAEAATG
ncbi:hypothetical protein [Streptomyces misionensis]|uniref:hypothetical protein n=1 Tax=Streptomyces misionensis TaxID=67331 RepID=UPI00396BBAB0